MSPDPRPEAVEFDPGSGDIPPSLGPILADPDTPILLLVAATADEASARAAIALADARARDGHETVLADGGLEKPRLHSLLDVPNLEGLSDLFLFGASVRHLTVRPDTRAFEFVSAGGYAPEPEEVLAGRRWERLAREFEASRSLLMVYVPADAPGLAELSRHAGKAVVIGAGKEATRAARSLAASCEVLATISPADAMAPGRLAALGGEADPETATIFDRADLEEPLVFRSERKRRSAMPLLLVLLLAALGAGAWYAYQTYFSGDVAPAPAQAAVPADVQTPEPDPGPPPTAIETPIPVSVAIEAHQDLETARQRVAALDRAEPGIDFYLAPVTASGNLYYRLLAGPVADQAAGRALMQRLVDEGHKTAMTDWDVRPSGLAFRLGEFGDEAQAGARVEALATRGIPAYVVRIRYDGGPDRYRVYGGAYQNEAEAEVMRGMLEEAGLEAELVERTGEPITVNGDEG